MLKYVLTSVVDLEELWLSLTGSPQECFISDMVVTNKYFWRNTWPLKVHGKTYTGSWAFSAFLMYKIQNCN